MRRVCGVGLASWILAAARALLIVTSIEVGLRAESVALSGNHAFVVMSMN